MSARDQIIDATCKLLELQGYHGTGLNQIIAESGSPKGSLYHYFPGGKEQLAVEALNYAGRRTLALIRGNLATSDDPAEAIRTFIMNVAFHVEHSGYSAGGPITTVALETALSSEALRETCRKIYQGWQDAFADRLIAGAIPENEARELATVIVCAIEGAIILCRTSRSRRPMELVAESMSRLIRNR